jgi:hypothetical protein
LTPAVGRAIPESRCRPSEGRPPHFYSAAPILTINGKAELVVQDAASYQRLLELAERIETVETIRQGMQELDEGKGISLDEFREHIRRRHNFQR